jgi:hypothetical protein
MRASGDGATQTLIRLATFFLSSPLRSSRLPIVSNRPCRTFCQVLDALVLLHIRASMLGFSLSSKGKRSF